MPLPPSGKQADPKEIATSFLKLAASGKVSEAFEKYVSRQDFRHHNPHFPGDANSLKAAMMEAHHFRRLAEVQRVLDRDIWVVHSEWRGGSHFNTRRRSHFRLMHDRLPSLGRRDGNRRRFADEKGMSEWHPDAAVPKDESRPLSHNFNVSSASALGS